MPKRDARERAADVLATHLASVPAGRCRRQPSFARTMARFFARRSELSKQLPLSRSWDKSPASKQYVQAAARVGSFACLITEVRKAADPRSLSHLPGTIHLFN